MRAVTEVRGHTRRSNEARPRFLMLLEVLFSVDQPET